MPRWTRNDSLSLYNVQNWASGYFGINEAGNVEVYPEGRGEHEGPRIDLNELLGQITRRGVASPILLRFDGILRGRVRDLNNAFERARAEYGYTAAYRSIYPIKVNQQRHVVEALLEGGRPYDMGLEAGSKPELLAVIALRNASSSLVVCNGYKDREYVEMALLATKLGIDPVLVIEKYSELETILEASERLGIPPLIGVRAKLSGRGAGRWGESGGDRSKFGLTTRQIVRLVEELKERDMLDRLQLLHFHLGSQITNIRALKGALREASRTLIGLNQLGAPMRWFDIGGGLGVDYDGSSTNFDSSMNYSWQEYANDVVSHLAEACEEAGIPQPEILSESGRALTAHHAVLVTEGLGVGDFAQGELPAAAADDEHDLIRSFADVCQGVTAKNYQESYHDALQLREEGMTFFNVGQLTMQERARVEEFFWRTCEKILRITRALDYVPDDLGALDRDMADIYYLNFSVFQSMPDSWAIQQLFPVLPLHRHDEEPMHRGILADITCDSDGKIDRFIDLRDVKRTLELHKLEPGQPYYLGHFLVGAYQEILGDMHNLFGDTNVVHVDVSADGRPRLVHVVRGDRVQEVLSYVEYFESDLLSGLRRSVEKALDEDRLSYEDSALILRRFEAGLAGYTYLHRDT